MPKGVRDKSVPMTDAEGWSLDSDYVPIAGLTETGAPVATPPPIKPFRGRLDPWLRVYLTTSRDFYQILGFAKDWVYMPGHHVTSIVTAYDPESGMIETVDARYQLVGKELR